MADKRISDLTQVASLNNGDMLEVAQVDAQAQSGFTSKKASMTDVGNKVNNSIEYTSALNTTSKTVIGAINELKAGGSTATILIGTSAPTSSQGVDGNLYVQYTAGTGGADDTVDAMYVKLDGAWCEIETGGGGSSTLAGLTDTDIDSQTLEEGQFLYYDDTNDVWINKMVIHVPVTQAQYDAMEQAGTLETDVYYPISDGNIEADDIDYDNTSSGLSATDVQSAIDEVKSDIPSNSDFNLSGLGDVSISGASQGQVLTKVSASSWGASDVIPQATSEIISASNPYISVVKWGKICVLRVNTQNYTVTQGTIGTLPAGYRPNSTFVSRIYRGDTNYIGISGSTIESDNMPKYTPVSFVFYQEE